MSASNKGVTDDLNGEEWEDIDTSLHNLFGPKQITVSGNEIESYRVSEYDDSEMSYKSDFVMEKLKGGDNFYDWIFQMENYLAMKGYSDCIIPKSDTELTIAKETDVTKLNAAKGILVLSMESCLHPHIRKCASALLIWTKIQELFEDRGHLRRTGLLEKLVTNKLDNCESMTVYIANVMTTVAKLENIGLAVGDEWVIAFLLVGLSEKFKSFIMSLGANKVC